MPLLSDNLSDRLKALGVRLGAQDLPPIPGRTKKVPIESVVPGEYIDTPLGTCFAVKQHFPPDYLHGATFLHLSSTLHRIAAWMGDPDLAGLDSDKFIFLDTETTGLAGGAGTLVFLIGVGRFDSQGFHLAQYFLHDPYQEPAQLAALIGFLGEARGLVTYNGKAFDVPLLNARFILNGERSPFGTFSHLDLLPLARRIWRDRLPSRSLGYIENHILGMQRTEEDVPGWLIPTLYGDYLRTGDASPLRSVFYHNAMDVLAMAALLNHTAAMLQTPHLGTVQHGIDLIAIGKLFEELGDLDGAAQCFADGLTCDLPQLNRREALLRWSRMEKRRQNLEKALELWQQAASENDIQALIELAKHYEHRQRDYSQALEWTQAAIQLLDSPGYAQFERQQLLLELEHRLARLQRKRGA